MKALLGKHQRWWLPVLVTLAAALQTSYFVRLSVRELAERGLALDDAYFYAVLAQNFERLGFLTFDGHMPTNGVQPLWQWVLIGLHQLLPGVEVMRLCFVGAWLAYLGFCWLLARYTVRQEHMNPALGSALVALLVTSNPSFQKIVLNGLEPALFLMCFAAWLSLIERWSRAWPAGVWQGRGAGAALGALGALCFLARTDWFWLVLLSAGFTYRRTRRLTSVVWVLVSAALLVLPYLVNNWFSHGHLMPISGRVKLELLEQFAPTFVDYLGTQEWQGAFSMLAGMFAMDQVWLGVPLAVALGVLALRRRNQLTPSLRWLLLGVLCHSLFMHLGYREVRPYTRYYFAVEGVVAAYLIMDLVHRGLGAWLPRRTWSKARSEASIAVLLGVIVVMLWGFSSHNTRPAWVRRIEMAEDLRALSADAKIAAYWPGAFAYFSGRPVLPLDGIIGSAWYLQHVVKKKRELDYALEQGVDHLVIHDFPLKSLTKAKAPEPKNWSDVGRRRLWEQCRYVTRLVSARADPRTQNGWYLYRLSPTGAGSHCAAGRLAP